MLLRQCTLTDGGAMKAPRVPRGPSMRAGQRVYIKPASALAREWRLAPRTEGVVLCAYEVLGGFSANRKRVDVRLSPGVVAWGISADQIEPAPGGRDEAA